MPRLAYYERIRRVAVLNIALAVGGDFLLGRGAGLLNACLTLGMALGALYAAHQHEVDEQ